MKRLVAQECNCWDWVGDWNDDKVTQEPHSGIHGFSLLAINCQSTGENCKLYSKPIRAKCVYGDVYVWMPVCHSVRDYVSLRTGKIIECYIRPKMLLPELSVWNVFIWYQKNTKLWRDDSDSPTKYTAPKLTKNKLRCPLLIGKYNQMTRQVPFACQISFVVGHMTQVFFFFFLIREDLVHINYKPGGSQKVHKNCSSEQLLQDSDRRQQKWQLIIQMWNHC